MMQIRKQVVLKYAPVYLINILLLVVECIVCLENWGSVVGNSWTDVPFVFSITALIINLFTIWRFGVGLLDFRVIFFLLSYVFMFGRIWLRHLELDGEIFWVLHKMYDAEILFNAGLFVTCCMQALFVGMFFGENLQQSKSAREDYELKTSSNVTRDLYTTAMILLAVGVPSRLMTDINSILSTASGSYTSISTQTGLAKDFANFFLVGAFCLMEARPKLRIPILGTISVYFISVMILTGDRRYYVAALLAFGVYYLTVRKKKSKKTNPIYIAAVVFVGAVFLNFLAVIRKIRLGNLGTITEFFTNYGEDLFALTDVLYEFLAEFGISFFSVASVIKTVPDVFPYQYGLTLLKTVPSIVPIGWMLGDFFDAASPSTYINAYTRLPVGATIFGDLYVNFGFGAIIACIFMGVLIKKIFNVNLKTCNSVDRILYYVKFYVMINAVRCCIFELFRPYVWCVLVVIILLHLVSAKPIVIRGMYKRHVSR